MFPPLPVLMRVAMSHFVHDGYTVPKGALSSSPLVRPTAAPTSSATPTTTARRGSGPAARRTGARPYGLIGFGGGVHGCIGLAFAQQQLKIIWSLLLRRFDLEAMQPLGPADHSTFVARPSDPCVIRYRRRESTP